MPILPRAYSVLLGILLCCWLGLIVGGALTQQSPISQSQKIPLLHKIICTFLLFLCALTIATGIIRALRPYARLLTCGMFWGFLGDLVMGRIVGVPGLDHLILGMLVFGACHVCYIVAFRHLAIIINAAHTKAWRKSLVLMLCLGAADWIFLVQTPLAVPVRNWAAFGYALTIWGMAGCALAVTWQRPYFVFAFVGAMLLIVSDTLLAAYVFRDISFRYIDDVIWLIFNVGQALIVFSPLYIKNMRFADNGDKAVAK